MEGNSIIGMAGGFIALSIMLGIGTLILGGSVSDCTTVNDYVAATIRSGSGSDNTTISFGDDGGLTNDHNLTGWAGQCFSSNAQSQSGYGLLMVSLIVLAAAVVLIVVRMLSG